MKRLALLLLVLGIACKARESAIPGDPERGRQLIAQYGCNVCHTVPGVSGPQGSIGPALAGVASRPTISYGTVQNTPENLVKFIQSPASLNPSSNMPGLGMPPADAQDIAAYLRTVR